MPTPIMPYAYNANPAPSNYSSTFGGIPGPVNLPIPFQDISNIFPGLGDINKTASSNLLSEFEGQLSPGTQNLLQDASARFGVSSGMPGSGLSGNKLLRNLGLTSEQRVQQAFKNYGQILPTLASTQTVSPNLQAEIASRNAQVRAAPVPGQAQSYAQSLFDKYLQMMRGPGGGTAGSSPAGGSGIFGGQQPLGGGSPLQYDPSQDLFPGLDDPGSFDQGSMDTIFGGEDF